MPTVSTPGELNEIHGPNVAFISIFLGKGCIPLIIVSKANMTPKKAIVG